MTPLQRRAELFITHKVSNHEQSLSIEDLKRNLIQQAELLGVNKYTSSQQPALDLVMIHSPLTNSNQRLSTYAKLCELQQRYDHLLGAVGVCHFGVQALDEIVNKAKLPPPAVIQLELSPFHQHTDITESWCREYDTIISCAAWSKLSSNQGPIQQWDELATKIAQPYGITKQQVLILWSLQRGYVCVPRSGSQYKIERKTINENSWNTIQHLPPLSIQDMNLLNSFNVGITAGQLGILDGWTMDDIPSTTTDNDNNNNDATITKMWDPTNIV